MIPLLSKAWIWTLVFGIFTLWVTPLQANFKILGGSIKNQDSGPVEFDTDNDSVIDIVMQLNANMGIGTTAPTGNLHVVGNVQIDEFLSLVETAAAPDALSGNGLLYNISGNLFYKDGNGNEVTLVDGGNGMWALSEGNIHRDTGNVGIGTSTPEHSLHVLDGDIFVKTTSGSTGTLYLFDTSHGIERSSGEVRVFSNAAISIQPSGAEVAQFTSSGLIVNENAGLNYDFRVEGGGGNPNLFFVDVGNKVVGINQATVGAMLHIQTTGTGAKGQIVQATSGQSANLLEWQDGSGEILGAIGPSGNLSVGTSVPSANLHVAGNVQVDEYVSLLEANAPTALSGNGLLYHNSGNVHFMDATGSATNLSEGAGFWTLSSGNIYRNSGFIGMGNTAPNGRLHLEPSATTGLGLVVKALPSQSANLAEFVHQTGNVHATVTENGDFSNTQGETNSEVFGKGATVIASNSVAIGKNATAGGSQGDSVVIGYNASDSANGRNVVIGASASVTSAESAVVIGRSASANTSSAVVIGNGAGGALSIGSSASSISGSIAIGTSATANTNDSVAVGKSSTGLRNSVAIGSGAQADAGGERGSIAIGQGADNNTFYATAIGRGAVNHAHYEFVGGGNSTVDQKRTEVYFGYGVKYSAPADVTFHGTAGDGVDIAGGALRIAGGLGSGKGLGGNVVFLTAGNSTTGSSLNSLSERMVIDYYGNIGIGVSGPTQKIEIAGNIVASSANTYTLGTAAVTWDNIFSKDFTMVSDRRLKDEIRDLEPGLGEIMQLRPVSYAWKGKPKNDRQYGLIAQEVKQVLDDAVNVGEDKDQTMGVHYSNLVPVLIKAIQEQQKTIKSQSRDIDELKSQVKGLLKNR